MPDNITNLCIFFDDQQILHFMANANTFKDAVIDEEKHKRSLQAKTSSKKGHLILKGVTSLEKLYDLQERFQGPRKSKTHSFSMMHELINLEIDKIRSSSISVCVAHNKRGKPFSACSNNIGMCSHGHTMI